MIAWQHVASLMLRHGAQGRMLDVCRPDIYKYNNVHNYHDTAIISIILVKPIIANNYIMEIMHIMLIVL
jgi:hypothetical protein